MDGRKPKDASCSKQKLLPAYTWFRQGRYLKGEFGTLAISTQVMINTSGETLINEMSTS